MKAHERAAADAEEAAYDAEVAGKTFGEKVTAMFAIPPLAERWDAAVLTTDELKAIEPAASLIDGWLSLDSLAMLYGPSGTGKTFVALDLALHIATGSWWNGHEVTPGPVLYIVAEGAGRIGARVDAWQQQHQVHELDRFHPVHWLPVAVNLHDAAQAGAFVDWCAAFKPVLVVFDTLARCTLGAEENSARDMGLVIAHVDLIRRATGACVLVVHHTGKDLSAGGRGSSALKGALDTEIEISGDEQITIRVSKQKDGVEASARLRRVPLGESCVLLPGNGPTSGELTTKQRDVLETLAGIELPGGIASSKWQAACVGISTSTFYVAVRRLLTDHMIENIGTDRLPRYVTAAGHGDEDQ